MIVGMYDIIERYSV